MTKEFRRELDTVDYRLPGGKVCDTLVEYNEHRKDITQQALIAVNRECEEEAWLIPQNPVLYHISKAWTTIERDLYYYVIEKFTQHADGQHLETGEHITVEWKSKEEIKDIIKNWWMQEDRSVWVLLRFLN